MLASSVQGTPDQVARERRRGDRIRDQSDRMRRPRAQTPGDGVRPVVQDTHGMEHPRLDVRRDSHVFSAPREDEGRSRLRNTGKTCDVREGNPLLCHGDPQCNAMKRYPVGLDRFSSLMENAI